VLAVVLLIFGSKELPELARGWVRPPSSSARGLHDERDPEPRTRLPLDLRG